MVDLRPSLLRGWIPLARLGIGLLVGGSALSLIDWRGLAPLFGRGLFQSLSRGTLSVSVIGQILSLSICALALRILDPRLTLLSSFLSRWCRDGVGALPAGVPGLGEAAGIRVLTLFGLPAGAALVVSTADILAESVAQGVYASSAFLLAPASLRAVIPQLRIPLGAVAVGMFLGIAGSAWGLRYAPARWRTKIAKLLASGIVLLKSRAFAASTACHLAAWIAGGVQIYCIGRVLGDVITLTQALSLEGIVFALRAAFFFVSAGVGVQELALAAVGASYGLRPIEIVALAVLLRLRDVIVLTPGLLAWAGLELQRALTRPARTTKPLELTCVS